MKTRWIAGVLAFAAFTGLMTGCSGSKEKNISTAETTAPAAQTNAATAATTEDNIPKSADGNTFVITLYPEDAPISCENFTTLVKDGFYDGECCCNCIHKCLSGGVAVLLGHSG